MPAEQDPNEADEWQEDEDMLAGGGASLDSHAVHGPVRHLLKDNAQRAVLCVLCASVSSMRTGRQADTVALSRCRPWRDTRTESI